MKEVTATLHCVEDIERYIEIGVNAIIVGNEKFTSRLPLSLTVEEIEKIINQVSNRIKVYVEINHLIHEEKTEPLTAFLLKLNEIGVSAVIFQDFAVPNIIKKHGLNLEMHYNPETLNTNSDTIDFLGLMGIKRFSLARELSLDEMLDITQHTNREIEIQIHGCQYIANSGRMLVSNYFEYETKIKDVDTSINGNLKIKVQDMDDVSHIFEDQEGTHVMTENILSSFDYLDMILPSNIQVLRIDTLFAYDLEIIEIYIKLARLYFEDNNAYQTYKHEVKDKFSHKLFYSGFLNDGTVYTIEKVRERENLENNK